MLPSGWSSSPTHEPPQQPSEAAYRTVAAAAHARLAQSYAARRHLSPSRLIQAERTIHQRVGVSARPRGALPAGRYFIANH
jgi:hypothetical protein